MTFQSLARTEQLISKLILKSEVTLPILSAIKTQKVAQRVTTISPLSHKITQPIVSKTLQLQQSVVSRISKQNQQKQTFIKSKLEAGESAFSRKQYQRAILEYNSALSMLDELKSAFYYRVLMRKTECTKCLRDTDQLFKLCSELSLVSVGN